VRKAIEGKPVQHGDRTIRVTASFGVAGYPESTALRDALFPAADRALYDAKEGGRNRVRIAGTPAG
jgi:diguanylate cyclase (GGDEF)-like protein